MQGIYHNPTLGLISLVNGSTVITIADKNLGATTVYNDGDTLSEANCGKYYQWGNNYGFSRTGDITTSSTRVNASSYGPGNYYSSSTFITINSSPYDWSSVQNNNLWGGVTGTNEAMQGPCDTGYHIPKNTEWQSVYDIGVSLGIFSSSSGNSIKTYLKMPFAGFRDKSSSADGQGTYALYWASTAHSANRAYILYAYSSMLNPQNGDLRTRGFSLRPFKNTPVMPDKTWTVIYGDEFPKPTIIHGSVGTKKAIKSIPPQPITTAGIYRDEDNGLISLSSNGTTWLTIADKNLGATTVYNDGDTLSKANCGKYYQWGNNYGFSRTGDITTSSTQVDASSYGPGNYYSSSTFITRSSSPYDWSSVQNDNLWGGVTGTNEAMQGPCASGYHIPTTTERQAVYDIGVSLGIFSSSSGNAIKTYLKMPFAGYRKYSSSSVGSQGTYALYWSSTAYSADIAYRLDANSSTLNPQYWYLRAVGYSLRPFKNVAVQPTVERTVLYQSS